MTARREVKIVNTYGLHLRPSSKFVKLASGFQSDVWVHLRDTKANGKSLLDMTTLAAECGTTLEIEASRPRRRAGRDGPGRTRGGWISYGRRGGLR